MNDRHSTPPHLKTPDPPCTSKSRYDAPSHPQPCTIPPTHRQACYIPDVQTKRAPRSLHQRTSIPSPARACDRRTDRESPYRAARTSPATTQPPTPKEYYRRPATSSRRCSHETEIQLA